MFLKRFACGGLRKWSGRAVARHLGVSHKYIQELTQEFAINPNKMRGQERTYGEPTFELLRRAQELIQQQRARGYLRSPRRHAWAPLRDRLGCATRNRIGRKQILVQSVGAGTLPMWLEPALLRNSLWRWQERSTMRHTLSQIGNPG